jgi:predicted permease
MNWLKQLFIRHRRYDELSASISEHLDEKIADLIDSGMTREKAERAARLEFGNVTRIEERSREIWQWPRLESIWADIRYAGRQLIAHPLLAGIAISTVALGIAANVSVFSFVNALFLSTVPAKDPARLVRIFSPRPNGEDNKPFSYPEYDYLRQNAHTLESFAAHYSTAPLYVTVNEESLEVQGAVVSNNYFSILGLSPFRGRFFATEEDSVPDRYPVAVISYPFWQHLYGGDPNIIGRSLTINKQTFDIVGVAPNGFQGVEIGGTPNDIWIPTMMVHAGYRWCDGFKQDCTIFQLLAQLKPGISAGSAQAQVATLLQQFLGAHPTADKRPIVLVQPAIGVTGSSRHYFTRLAGLLAAVAGTLLLVACANIAGLLITRGATRRAELAVRCALGAGRLRIIRQLLTENLLVAFGAGAAGILLSLGICRWLTDFYTVDSEGYRHFYNVQIDGRVLLYSIILTALTGILFGLLPAVQASRTDINDVLKSQSGTRGTTRTRTRSLLIVVQVGLSFALVVAAGLLVRSTAFLDANHNLDLHQVVGLRLRPKLVQYSPQKAQDFLREALDRARALPGVQSASLASMPGLVWGDGDTIRLAIPGRTYAQPADEPLTNFHQIAPAYFATLRIPFIGGRDLTGTDREGFPRVAIINQTLSKQLFSSGSPLGRGIVLNDQSYQVVGEVKDAQISSDLEGAVPMAYLPFWQNDIESQVDARMCVRVDGDPDAFLTTIRRSMAIIDPNVPITETMPLMEQVRATYADARMAGVVVTAAGALTLLLSAIGLFGTIGYEVNRRTREIGIRIALGAQPQQVIHNFLRQGLTLVLSGIAIGIILALLSTRLLGSWLFGVRAYDPVMFLCAAGILVSVTAAAIYLPARRAATIDPVRALRTE